MSSRPSGTVTFLFTDIEGSTRMWEEHAAAMQAALEQHDRIMRTAIEDADGYVFTTAGDAFAAAFADPAAGLTAAIEAQRGLASATWDGLGSLSVRMGLHTGVAHERDGDYFGPALSRAARIMAAGHGGQILLSLGTEELVEGSQSGSHSGTSASTRSRTWADPSTSTRWSTPTSTMSSPSCCRSKRFPTTYRSNSRPSSAVNSNSTRWSSD